MIEITRVRIQLHEPHARPDGRKDWRLKAFADVTLDDCLAIKGLKVLMGDEGNLFVAFPSHRVEDHCPADDCRTRVALGDAFCRKCGVPLEPDRGTPGPDGKVNYHADVCHPITTSCREAIQDAVFEAYHDAVEDRHAVTSGPLAARVRAEAAA